MPLTKIDIIGLIFVGLALYIQDAYACDGYYDEPQIEIPIPKTI